MKSILISTRPQWVAKILNGEKTIEVRKRFPTNYVGWVYIYCTKDKKYANLINRGGFLTGMVVARFWCDKVEEIVYSEEDCEWKTKSLCFEELLNKSLTHDYLLEYLGDNGGYAIHITKLEIFDKPKNISEFEHLVKYTCNTCPYFTISNGIVGNTMYSICEELKPLTCAPQSYCYIEI